MRMHVYASIQYDIDKKIMEDLRDAGVSSTQATKAAGHHVSAAKATHDSEERYIHIVTILL